MLRANLFLFFQWLPETRWYDASSTDRTALGTPLLLAVRKAGALAISLREYTCCQGTMRSVVAHSRFYFAASLGKEFCQLGICSIGCHGLDGHQRRPP